MTFRWLEENNSRPNWSTNKKHGSLEQRVNRANRKFNEDHKLETEIQPRQRFK